MRRSLLQSALCVCLSPLLAAQQIVLPNAAPPDTPSAKPVKPAVTPSVNVLVLDALSGKPHANIEVHSTCEDGGTWTPSPTTKTDINGLAIVPSWCATEVKVNVWTYIEGDKLSECGAMEGQLLQKILEVGVISDPRAAGGIWCPAKVIKRMTPVPGQVILFVKKPTWWQVHVAG